MAKTDVGFLAVLLLQKQKDATMRTNIAATIGSTIAKTRPVLCLALPANRWYQIQTGHNLIRTPTKSNIANISDSVSETLLLRPPLASRSLLPVQQRRGRLRDLQQWAAGEERIRLETEVAPHVKDFSARLPDEIIGRRPPDYVLDSSRQLWQSVAVVGATASPTWATAARIRDRRGGSPSSAAAAATGRCSGARTIHGRWRQGNGRERVNSKFSKKWTLTKKI